MILASWGFPSLGYAGEAMDESSSSQGSQRPWLFGQTAPFSQPIVTDRPSFSVGPGTIPRGRIQFETGYTFSFEDAHPNVKTHTFPETLVRLGLTDRLELRVEWPTLTFIEKGTDVHGLNDLALGFKIQVFQQQGFRPRLSFTGRLSIPTGHEDLSSDRLDPELRTILTYALNEWLGVFGNVVIAVPTSQEKRFVQVSSSLGLSGTIRERVSGYIEYFGYYPVEVAGGSGHFLQTGILYLLAYHIQLDARMGAGLNRGTDDLFSGAGISWRF
jgi:hypothetical protein